MIDSICERNFFINYSIVCWKMEQNTFEWHTMASVIVLMIVNVEKTHTFKTITIDFIDIFSLFCDCSDCVFAVWNVSISVKVEQLCHTNHDFPEIKVSRWKRNKNSSNLYIYRFNIHIKSRIICLPPDQRTWLSNRFYRDFFFCVSSRLLMWRNDIMETKVNRISDARIEWASTLYHLVTQIFGFLYAFIDFSRSFQGYFR